ncbi:MAG TPA: glycosyltransferase family 4 protein [Burkholderiales bacterium]|nr:glycosyltransferase family 4 protein [Burkholderiales bacterium]
MRLALLVVYYPPSRASAAVQMSDLAASFTRQGHEVTVFTTSPEAPAALVEEVAGVRVVRVPTGRVKEMGLLKRAISEIFMSLALWRGARRCGVRVEDFDGVIWYSPTIFLAPFVAWIKRRSRARAYLILRDIFPQWAVDAGVMRRGPAYYFFRVFERFQYRVADVIGVQSPANLAQVRADTHGRRRLEVLYNWIDVDRTEPLSSGLVERHGLAGKRILVYGGNMGVAQDMDNLVRLAERLRGHGGVALLLVGAGSDVERLRRVLSERALVNVVLVDEVDPDEFRAVLRRCHVGLITLDRRLTTHNIPGKLLAYLEAGLPVAASVNPGNDLLTIIQSSGAGIGFVNGNDEEFAQATLALACDEARRADMSNAARALLAERFSIESVTGQLLSALEDPVSLEPAAAA